MSVFRNVMVYLGLGADEEYDDNYLAEEAGDESVDSETRREPGRASAVPQRAKDQRGTSSMRGSFSSGSSVDRPSAVGAVRPLRSVPSIDDENGEHNNGSDGVPRMTSSDDSRIRSMPIQRSKPRSLAPQSFGDAKIIADELRKSVPVIMNLRGLDRDLARRLIDFASGSCYSLGGKMEKIAPQVFLLLPKSVEVSDDDRRRIDERGFDRD